MPAMHACLAEDTQISGIKHLKFIILFQIKIFKRQCLAHTRIEYLQIQINIFQSHLYSICTAKKRPNFRHMNIRNRSSENCHVSVCEIFSIKNSLKKPRRIPSTRECWFVLLASDICLVGDNDRLGTFHNSRPY